MGSNGKQNNSQGVTVKYISIHLLLFAVTSTLLLACYLSKREVTTRVGNTTCSGDPDGMLKCEAPSVICYFDNTEPVACKRKIK